MKIQKFIFGILAVLPSVLFGSSWRDGYSIYYPGEPAFVFGQSVQLRHAAEFNSPAMLTLSAASRITIIGPTDSLLTVNGYSAPWYQVSFEEQGALICGYIWGGLIAQHHWPVNPSEFEAANRKLIFGITGIESGKYQMEVREMANRKIILIKTMDCPGDGQMMTAMYTEPVTCLPGIDSLLFLMFDQGPCISNSGGEIVIGIRKSDHFVILANEEYSSDYPGHDDEKTQDIFRAISAMILIGDGQDLEPGMFLVEKISSVFAPQAMEDWSEVSRENAIYRWDGTSVILVKTEEWIPEI